jgi:hypothetical protein
MDQHIVVESDGETETNDYCKMLDNFVDAFVYEPTTITGQTHVTYMFEPPNKQLHDYIKAFNSNNLMINNNTTNSNNEEMMEVDDCLLCVGTDGNKHLFLEAEGFCGCTECGRICCLSCICCNKEQTSVSKYCYDCFLSEVSVTTEKVEEERHTLSNIQLHERLRSMGIATTLSDRRDELLDMYEAKRGNTPYDDNVISANVIIPNENSKYLHDLQQDDIVLSKFKFKDGGSFIVNEKFTPEQILSILKIICSLVIMYKNKSTDTTTEKRRYKNIPACIVEFSEKARIHKGYRLV